MHNKNDVIILKGKDKLLDPINEANRKKDAKKDKSLALKVSQSEVPEISENMVYPIGRFQKIMRKRGALMKKRNLNKAKNSNNVCFKCGKP